MAAVDPRKLYDEVEGALRALACDIGCAECHGMLCGMLCNPERFDAASWLQHVTGHTELKPIGEQDSGHVLWQLLRYTQHNIEADDYSFMPLLPHDRAAKAIRIQSLGAWCRGFLSGFGLAGVTDLSVLSQDNRDFLRDLSRIARADEQSGGGEHGELALAELIEYVRIGALMLRDETRFTGRDLPAEPALH
jgi:yecA family protein